MDSVTEQFTRCLTLCKEHLGGIWKDIPTKDENKIVRRVSGGLSNFLFAACLPDDMKTVGDEPRHVLIRFYGVTRNDPQAILKDSLVFALLSQKGLGPTFYGCFEDGRFEEFIPTRSLTNKEMPEEKTMQQLAFRLAVLHDLKMPLRKDPMVERQMREWYQQSMNNSSVIMAKNPTIWKEFCSHNIADEIMTLSSWLERSGSPIVFAHNDTQEGNILLGVNGGDYTLIDFEYSGYNYRGFEFANHFLEYCYDYTEPNFPLFKENLASFPTEQMQRKFFTYYLSAKNFSHEEMEPQIRKLLNEVHLFILAVHLFWSMWSFVSVCSSEIEFGYLEFGICRLRRYLEFKEKLMKERPYLIPK